MIMKWLDLEPGDKLKFRKEVIDFFEIAYRNWASRVSNKIFEIKQIVVAFDYIAITFMDYPSAQPIFIKFDGSPAERFAGFHSELFEIVELAQ